MDAEWLASSRPVVSTGDAPALTAIIDFPQDEAGIDKPGYDEAGLGIEVRVNDLGVVRSDAASASEIAVLLQGAGASLAAAALWDGIVAVVRAAIARRRRPSTAGAATESYIMTVVVPGADGPTVIQSDIFGPGAVTAGVSAVEKVVLAAIESARVD